MRWFSAGDEPGFPVMLTVTAGAMTACTFGMAPATLVAGAARFVDLDGPLLIGRDRDPGLHYQRGLVSPPSAALWG